MAVGEPAAVPPTDGGEDEEPVLAEELTIPYLFTTGPLTTPNLLMMFTEPQRVPPLRLATALAPNAGLPFGYRASRSERGAWVDGILLRAENPAALHRAILAAGGSEADDPVRWASGHRQVVTDRAERDQLTARRRTGRRIQLAALVLFLATSIVGRILVLDDDSWWPLLPFVGLLAGSFGLAAFGRRLSR